MFILEECASRAVMLHAVCLFTESSAMLSLFFIAYSLFTFVIPTEQQMLSHQHKLEQSCAVCEQKFLGVIRTQIMNLESSIKDRTTRMEILQQKLADRDTALEQRIPPHLPQILQNLQSSLQTLTGRCDDLENIISNVIIENVTAVERRIPYNQSTLKPLTAGTDNQENCINEKVTKLEQRLPSDLQTTLQNLQSTVQTLTARTDTLENSITQKVSALEQRIPNLQSTLESLTARTDTLENTITEKVTALEQRVQNLQSTQRSLTARTDTLEYSITEKVTTVERRVPTSLSSTLQDLNSFVQRVQSRLNIVDTCRQSFLMLTTQPLTGTFQHRCYFYGTSELTWEAAQARCRQAGANLVTVSSWGLQRYLQSFVPKEVNMWIGGSDKGVEGRFKWVENNENIDDGFTYWKEGEPNDKKQREDCLEIMGTSNGNWNDESCYSNRSYICEL